MEILRLKWNGTELVSAEPINVTPEAAKLLLKQSGPQPKYAPVQDLPKHGFEEQTDVLSDVVPTPQTTAQKKKRMTKEEKDRLFN